MVRRCTLWSWEKTHASREISPRSVDDCVRRERGGANAGARNAAVDTNTRAAVTNDAATRDATSRNSAADRAPDHYASGDA